MLLWLIDWQSRHKVVCILNRIRLRLRTARLFCVFYKRSTWHHVELTALFSHATVLQEAHGFACICHCTLSRLAWQLIEYWCNTWQWLSCTFLPSCALLKSDFHDPISVFISTRLSLSLSLSLAGSDFYSVLIRIVWWPQFAQRLQTFPLFTEGSFNLDN